jgi:hypothetical protein
MSNPLIQAEIVRQVELALHLAVNCRTRISNSTEVVYGQGTRQGCCRQGSFSPFARLSIVGFSKSGSASPCFDCSDNQYADGSEQNDKSKPVEVAPRGKYLSDEDSNNEECSSHRMVHQMIASTVRVRRRTSLFQMWG